MIKVVYSTGLEYRVLANKIFVIDIDGTLCEDIPNERWQEMIHAKEISGAKDWVNARFDEGNYVCLFTARTVNLESITETWLKEHGFKFHKIIYGKPRKLGYESYHYIDNTHVQVTTLKEEFSALKKVQHEIEVFS